MSSIVDEQYLQWVEGKSPIEARISIYERIRDIPYAGVPELADPERYVEILTLGRGSCTPKHLLLCAMYQKLGLTVLFVAYPFRWDDVEIDYPRRLQELAQAMPTSHHLACKVELDSDLVVVDATLDPPLKRLGLPINEQWDGTSDTVFPVPPCGQEQIYHPSEAYGLRPRLDDASLAFYEELNRWLEKVRQS